MKPKEAYSILTQAMQLALSNGLFKDFQSVNVVQQALTVILEVIQEPASNPKEDIKARND